MQYQQVMGQNPSQFNVAKVGKDTSQHPVDTVSWHDTADFCTTLSEKEGLQPFEFDIRKGDELTKVDTGYRLPTEAEWEFASRGGTTTRHWIGESDDHVSQAAWMVSNSQLRTHPVGELLANPFGLFDTSGNVEEWMYDGWEMNYFAMFRDRPAIDPMGVASEVPTRTTRGSYWDGNAISCRISRRFAVEPTGRHHTLGFRTALSVDAVRKAEKARKEASENPSSSVPR